MISYLLPTRDRPRRLDRTLHAIGALPHAPHAAAGGAEVIIVDNASDPPVTAPPRLANDLPVRVVRRPRNEWAAGRNAGAEHARGDWLLMLDDDSHPVDASYLTRLPALPHDIAAVGADITLPDGRREAGGLPEVFVGCGVAIRREVFLDLGGYDALFEYYVEEYDFCAKVLHAGYRVVHDTRFRVRHEKTATGRDFNAILRRLVRNNIRVIDRYAPAAQRAERRRETLERYRAIGAKEDADAGYQAGLRDLETMSDPVAQRPMDGALFDRFTGRAAVADALAAHRDVFAGRDVLLVSEGKNGWVVREVVASLGGTIVEKPTANHVRLIGTISPGPMLDARDASERAGCPALLPWCPAAHAPLEQASVRTGA